MIPPLDITKPRTLAQDAALGVAVLRRFKESAGPFTSADAGRTIELIERLYEAAK